MRSLTLATVALVAAVATAGAQTTLVIVSGVGGDAERRERFYALGQSLADAARDRLGIAPTNIIFLAEKVERDPARIHARSTRENVMRVLDELAEHVGAMAQVAVVLIGHGSFQGEDAYFNVPGPDLSAQDFDNLLDRFPTQRIAFVNTTSASGGFLAVMSGERRAILTATKSGFERNETLFPEFFVAAFASDVADIDKDDRVSLLEAFTYARREVGRVYEQDGRLLTEHAQLDDNGDGEGTDDPHAAAKDGAFARTFFLDAVDQPEVVVSSDPALRRLNETKGELERQIAELRNMKGAMNAEQYELELERLLVELARTSQLIRTREKKQ